MQRPSLHDTIVAISSGWRASPIGIIRLSGPDAALLLRSLEGAAEVSPGAARAIARDAVIGFDGLRVPARTIRFAAPHSFTGQDVVELYVPGSLPLLKRLVDWLVEQGARQALPGEFSARAYVNGKLTGPQVEGVLGLIHAHDGAAARRAARLARGELGRELHRLRDEILDLLARLEAGIDFVDEEDVRFVTAPQVRECIDGWLQRLPATESAGRRERPHVVLAGMPNAGKSSLFNALVGRQRTIVSPRPGTTRDVIAAEVEFDGVAILLQDTAGVGAGEDELEFAANRAAEQAIAVAEIVVWVHDAAQPWSPDEQNRLALCERERVLHVASKIDLPPNARAVPASESAVRLSVRTGQGLEEFRTTVAQRAKVVASAPSDSRAAVVVSGLKRTRDLVSRSDNLVTHPELVALELRALLDTIGGNDEQTVDDAILGVIFSKFCFGK